MEFLQSDCSLSVMEEVPNNPYCGFYTIYRFFVHEYLVYDWNCPLEDVPLEVEQSICLIEINLAYYRNKPLSGKALKRVAEIFSWFRRQNKVMIVRFLYDWDGHGLKNEPSNMQTILFHMEQLGPLLNEFASFIYIIQGLFIGSWGEMHGSHYQDERSLRILTQQLYTNSGDVTFIALRCPWMWRAISRTFTPLSNRDISQSGIGARLSLFNDALLASNDDLGTYGNISKEDAKLYSDKLTREDEINFQNKLCLYVPNGGETVLGDLVADFKEAHQYFAAIRLSYLNSKYDSRVLDKWRHEQIETNDSLWRGKSAYKFLASHLGYRFILKKMDVSKKWFNRNRFHISLTIENQGFASAYRPFEVQIVARAKGSKTTYTSLLKTDTRSWLPGRTISLKQTLDVTKWQGKSFTIGLRIWDPFTEQAICLGNSLARDPNGMHILGYLQLGVER